MATSEVGLHHILKQIDNCDIVVANIDKIVPKLYKIRQQVLSQKEYINDIQRDLLTTGTTSILNNVVTFSGQAIDNTLVSSTYTGAAFNTNDSALQKNIIQSLFKYRHEVGTSTHFTTEQMGTVEDRTNGLNLKDVVNITTSLNSLLSASNTIPATNSDLNNLILKTQSNSNTHNGVIPDVSKALTDPFSANSYGATDTVNGLDTHLVSAITVSDTIVGFGIV